jgi:hypothetical protein
MIDTGIPLGVRMYDLKDGVDIHLTRWVDDFSFRHTAPGGCASATIKFRVPDGSNVDPQMFGSLYYRIQIFDKRSAEVLWEGRVEDPATQVAEDAWELGVLGGQVATTDVNMPVLYIDNTVAQWRTISDYEEIETGSDDKNNVLTAKVKSGYSWSAGQDAEIAEYNGAYACLSGIARIASTHKGTYLGGQGGNFQITLYQTGSFPTLLDTTTLNTGGVYKANVVGTDFTSGQISQDIILTIQRRTGTGTYQLPASEEGLAWVQWPKVIGMRHDEIGNSLVAASNYANDWVNVHQVVRDVVGRFLAGGWWTGTLNHWNSIAFSAKSYWAYPEQGSIRGTDAFIDSSDVHKITNLWWDQAVNAKDILNTLMEVQTNAYWAVWPSDHRFEQTVFDDILIRESQFRFVWARWPVSWNYLVSAEDGMEQQISGEGMYNAAAMSYDDDNSYTTGTLYANPRVTVFGSTVPWEVEEVGSRFTRLKHFTYPGGVIPAGFSGVEAEDYVRESMAAVQNPVNVGTITVRRPIQMRDDGSSDGNGFAGMVDPWELRPGKIVKIRDIFPHNNIGDMYWDSGITRTLNVNNGFESGTTGWGSAGGTFIQASDQKFAGSFAGKITPTGAAADTYIATAWALMTAFETYKAGAWVRCAVARSITIRIDFYNISGGFISNVSTTTSVAANTWTYIEVVAKAPLNAWQGPSLIVMSGTPAASNVMWVDEYYYQQIEIAPRGHENSMFRVAATEYNTADNSCKLELDELPRWDLSTQVVKGSGSGNLRTR